MKPERTLVNPTIDDFRNEELEQEEQEESIPVLKGQMHFDLGSENSPQQVIGATKMRIKKRAVILEFASLWRNPAVPFALTSLVLTPLILIVGGIFEFNKIPPRIPFYYNAVSNHWEQFDKALIFLFPISLLIAEAFIMNLTINLFQHDKKLSISISWIIVFINILLLIAVGQIYTLIT